MAASAFLSCSHELGNVDVFAQIMGSDHGLRSLGSDLWSQIFGLATGRTRVAFRKQRTHGQTPQTAGLNLSLLAWACRS